MFATTSKNAILFDNDTTINAFPDGQNDESDDEEKESTPPTEDPK